MVMLLLTSASEPSCSLARQLHVHPCERTVVFWMQAFKTNALQEYFVIEGGFINLAIAACTIFQVWLATPSASPVVLVDPLYKAPLV